MSSFDASGGECLVFVFREGLLSAVGHDLKILVTHWQMTVDWEKRSLNAEFDPNSLRVISAMENGAEKPGLSSTDIQQIEASIRKDVLEVTKYPTIKLVATLVTADDSFRVDGSLKLHGREKPVQATVLKQGVRLGAEIRLNQRDFGIRPYSAFFGALRVKPEIAIRLNVLDEPSLRVAWATVS
jgi:hypothetical protein